MAPSLSSTEVYTYVPFNGAEMLRLKVEPLQPGDSSPEPTMPSLRRKPMKLKGLLNSINSCDLTPILGTEFSEAKLVDWLKAPNSDEILRELAITSMHDKHPRNIPH